MALDAVVHAQVVVGNSDIVIIQSDVKTAVSDIIVLDAIVDAEVVKTATIASDLVIVQSDLKITEIYAEQASSDLVVLDAIVDAEVVKTATIASDLVISQSDIKVIQGNKYPTTTSGTIVEDSAMGTGTADITTVSSSAVANTFGAWAEIDAAVAADVWLAGITIFVKDPNLGADAVVIEIGTGAAASEVAKIRISFYVDNASDVGQYISIPITFPIPIKVASGTRIAVHVADEPANAVQYHVGVFYYLGL